MIYTEDAEGNVRASYTRSELGELLRQAKAEAWNEGKNAWRNRGPRVYVGGEGPTYTTRLATPVVNPYEEP